MRVALAAGLVDGLERRAGKLELAAGLQRDRALAGRLHQTDDPALVEDRIPAERALHAFQQRADAAFAAIGHGCVAIDIERELFVFGADAPLVARLVALCEICDEFVAALDRPEIRRVARHARPAPSATEAVAA